MKINEDSIIEETSSLCLIDGGSNTSLAGSNMRLMDKGSKDESVEVIGSSDKLETGMSGLPEDTYYGVVKSS